MRSNFIFEPKFNDSQAYAIYEPGFTPEELQKISHGVEQIDFIKATTVGQQDDAIRSSRIKWIPQDSNWWWLYERLAGMAEEANKMFWNFNIHSMLEQVQYTEYLATNKGHYTWHQDIGPGILSQRKISITVQLSHPDEYEGGDLEITQGADIATKMPRGEGTVVMFPSYMPHRVTPVTSGVRKSFVLWIGGEHYK